MTNEVFDTTGKICCICHEDFDNGQKIIVLTCGGHHVLHDQCYLDYAAFVRAQPVNDDGVDRDLDCPLCRRGSVLESVFQAQNFFKGGGKVNEDPIVIND